MMRKIIHGVKTHDISMRFKCFSCKLVIDEADIDTDGNCPVCHNSLVKMCERDSVACRCTGEMHSGIAYCSDCGEAACPECGCHDVVQISRVTGYLQEVSGFNSGKKQELKDRTRYNVA